MSPTASHVASMYLQGTYKPDGDAPAQGEWDRTGEDPKWRQGHHELVVAAVNSWKGDPVEMVLHARDEREGAPQPGSGSGRQKRAQAAALLYEMKHNSKVSRKPLYRGLHIKPQGEQSWSTFRKVAELWAGKNHGQVFELPAGTRGLQVSDYIGSPDPEKEWIVKT